jgi:hypothetical protein
LSRKGKYGEKQEGGNYTFFSVPMVPQLEASFCWKGQNNKVHRLIKKVKKKIREKIQKIP